MADRTRNSINRKLTLMVMLTTGISLLLACLAFVTYDVVTLQQAMLRDTSTLAEVIGSNSGAALVFDDADAARETLAALRAAEPVLAAVLYDRHGNEFARYLAPGTARTGAELSSADTAHHGFRDDHIEVSRNVVFSGQVIGSIFIRRSTRELTARIERYAVIVVLLLGAAVGVAGLGSLRLRRQISRPLRELVEVAEAMAGGDLSTRVVASSKDEIGVLARTFNAMAAGLRDLVGQARNSTRDVSEVIVTLRASGGRMALEAQRQKAAIDESAESLEQVGSSIEEVNAHVGVLAESARDTSASILEMDASIGTVAEQMDHLGGSIETTSNAVDQVAVHTDQMVQGVETLQQATEGTIECLEQLSLSVRQVQTNAEQSHALSEDSSAEASQGTTAVSETIIAMREISTGFAQLETSVLRLAEKSQAIDEIIQVIQGVAEQTTLLSLNAAIIAAQAGEHGKAFSVVADQVKNLADRTHSSAGEIAQIIGSVQEETAAAVDAVGLGSAKVERGVQRSNEAGKVLEQIMEKTQASTTRVRKISEASAKQTGDLQRLDDAMATVKGIVEQIGSSTRDQQSATSDISDAVGSIRSLGDRVRRSTEEQRQGSRLITRAVTNVAEMIDQIAEATQAQSKGHETIQHALQVLQDIANQATDRADEINTSVATLAERSQQLEREIGRFKTE